VLFDRLGDLRLGRLVTAGHDLRLRGHSSHRNAEDGAAAGATPG
jgi:hypothetical protein